MTNSTPRKPLSMQRGAWGSAAWITPECCRIRLKNPLGSLLINTMVYRTKDGISIIDPGWPWTLDALEQSLIDLEIITQSIKEVAHFIYTHTHIDHMGAAALLSWRTEATHHFLNELLPMSGDWHAFQDQMGDWDDWMLSLLAGEHREKIREELKHRKRRKTMTKAYGSMSINPKYIKTFQTQDSIQIDSQLSLNVLPARGHDPYHVVFLEPQHNTLISGDVFLAVPTPITGVMGDDLGMYEETLSRLSKLKPDILLPGHGSQLIGEQNVQQHMQRAQNYVDHYRTVVQQHLERHTEPQDLWSIGMETRPDDHILSNHLRWWTHLGLIQARLVLMLKREQIECIDDGDGPHYRLR